MEHQNTLINYQTLPVKQREDYNIHYHPSSGFAYYPNQFVHQSMHNPGYNQELSPHQLRFDDRINAENQDQFTFNNIYQPSSKSYFIPENNGFVDQRPPFARMDSGNFMDEYSNNYYTSSLPAHPNLSSMNKVFNSGNRPVHLINSEASTSQGYNTNGYRGFSHQDMAQSFQHSNVGWMEHPGYYTWGYAGGSSSIHGGYLYPEGFEPTNMHRQEYPDSSLNENSTSMQHPSSSFNYHQYLPPAIEMQHAYNHYIQVGEPSYWQSNGNPQPSYSYRSIPVAEFPDSPEESDWEENLEDEEYNPEVYPSWDLDYRHHEMGLDVDHMSYEDLLDLGEHIGHVCTGLSEDSILKNLKITLWESPSSPSLSTISSQSMDENCAICREEYKEYEKIGKLDCGHGYHATCIKEWLLIKNFCPVCRKTALKAGRGDN